ncbi:Carboxypeptidase [Mycena indigotica]|uniref:Carboxypeptidase n=1 Tax=Mycena indigotica TaxID=2126181 RepID=A0A8H6SQS8_9AGAR|nr:Carboxypeptidase [Mycena indigotica]KAF7302245.1 Carboxypeptidase [Mycena indigotica]
MLRSACWFAVLASSLLPALYFPSLSLAAPTDVPSAASFYVPSLPDIHQDPEHPLTIFSGHISSDPNEDKVDSKTVTAHLFFVMIKNRRIADKKRIMFWFNGGPGCSSFDGLMMEVGPWRMDGKGGFKVAEGGWEEYMTMVYIDQPAGTGFSYTSTDHYIHTMDEASAQLIQFLRNFYKTFPEYQKMETYLGGESYAGQWIPYFADAILNSDLPTPLHGVAIGNGWIDARRQYPSYIDYAVKVGILEENSDAWKAAKKRTDECVDELKTITDREPIVSPKCEGLLLDVTAVREKVVNNEPMCINIYDIRYDDVMPACGMNWPPDIKPVTTYLDRPDVVRALHAERHPGSWVECRGRIHQEFRERQQASAITVLPKLLARIPVLIFAGDQDLICNYVGLEAMIQAMEWNGAKGLGTVQTQSWSVANAPAGTWVSSRNLTYAKIFNASHMAPFDLPHVGHDMILRFIGVDFSALVGGSARIPSSLGTSTKPIFLENSAAAAPTAAPDATKSPQQTTAMWEAYYNAGAAALVLTVIFAIIGLCVWCRRRRNRSPRLPMERTGEESIPLNSSRLDDDEGSAFRDQKPNGNGKGKERAIEPGTPNIFKVGEDDESDHEEEGYRDR